MKPGFLLQVLYQDDQLLVVDKPSGLAVHRGWARDGEVIMSLARAQVGRRVFPVHRLDRGASGVLVLALAVEAARHLAAAFAAGRVRKRYLALVRGIPPACGVIDHPIPRAPGGPRVPAVTAYRRLATFERYAWLEVVPETGRLHQIRRHLKHLSHPLIGDVRYGKGEHNRLFRTRFGLWRLALHAAELRLEHPATGVPLHLEAPLPSDLSGPLAAMGLLGEATAADRATATAASGATVSGTTAAWGAAAGTTAAWGAVGGAATLPGAATLCPCLTGREPVRQLAPATSPASPADGLTQ